MNSIDLILLTLIAVAFCVMAVSFVVVISRNVRQGRVSRQKLGERVEKLRLGGMLRALGIDPSAYLHQRPLNEVARGAAECEQCESTQRCDSELEKAELESGKIDFCPNQASFSSFEQAQKPRPGS